MAMTPAEHTRRWRERQAGRMAPYEPLKCEQCGANRSGKRGPICHDCWLKTTEGREWNRQRIEIYRQKKRSQL